MSYPQQFPVQPEPAMPQAGPTRRPGTVTAACVLTWVFSGLVLLVFGYLAIAASTQREEVIDQLEGDESFQDLDVDPASVVDSLTGIGIAGVVICLVAILLAAMAFSGSGVGRIGLVVISALTAIVSLVASLAIVPFLWVIVSVTVIVLLFTGGAGNWYAARKRGF